MRSALNILILLIASSLTGCQNKTNQFETFCQIIEKYQGDTSDMAMYHLATEISEKTPELSDDFLIISTKLESEKYNTFLRLAKEHGFEQWECPALKEFLEQGGQKE